MTLSYNNLFQNGICNKEAQYTKEQNYALHPGALDGNYDNSIWKNSKQDQTIKYYTWKFTHQKVHYFNNTEI